MNDRNSRLCIAIRAVICIGFAVSAQRPAMAQAESVTAGSQGQLVRVPFVGCGSAGQAGPRPAPRGTYKAVRIPADAARQLAFYKAAEGSGVLAPNGWHCFELYGSSGEALYIVPQAFTSADLYSNSWGGFAGPIVEVVDESGGTSGRFTVAHVIARVFPAYRPFAENVIKEGIDPASDFQFHPFPQDKLNYRGKSVVEYQTPGNTKGLGTELWRLQKNASPIEGVAILIGNGAYMPDLVFLAVRLPEKLVYLAPIIVRRTENEAEHSNGDLPR